MAEVVVRRLRTGTVYRLFFVGLLFGAVPLASVLGVLGYFGFATLNWNGEPLTGMSALVGGPFMGLFFALTGTAFAGSGSPWALDIFEVCET